MTQEELDALMAEADDMPEADGATTDAPEQKKPAFSASEELDEDGFPKDYRVDAQKQWPPPPPSADHKMVQQLDRNPGILCRDKINLFQRLHRPGRKVPQIADGSGDQIERTAHSVSSCFLK